jgi:molybdenum cofactor synthesis domain-containing protein
MRPFTTLIPLKEARNVLLENARPVMEHEMVPIESSAGRVIAVDVEAGINVPPFARSAMDGYAVMAEDTYGAGEFTPKILNVVGVVRAGDESTDKVSQGNAVEAATGAVLPEGADAVVKVEMTEISDAVLKVFKPVHPHENVSQAGSDIASGEAVLTHGDVLHPGKIGVLAALGIEDVEVLRKPTVAVAPTGNEVCELGKEPTPSQVFDVNSYTIMALAERNGCDATRHHVVEDTLESIGAVLDKAKESDVVIFSGGSSVGERDILVDVLAERGDVIFHGVQIKPGKPTLFGKIGEQLVFGLPGYPAACLTVGNALIAPMLRRMASLPEGMVNKGRFKLVKRVVSTLGRHQFLTVKIENGMAVPVFKESGAITSLGDAEGYIEIPDNTDFVEKDETVEVVFF